MRHWLNTFGCCTLGSLTKGQMEEIGESYLELEDKAECSGLFQLWATSDAVWGLGVLGFLIVPCKDWLFSTGIPDACWLIRLVMSSKLRPQSSASILKASRNPCSGQNWCQYCIQLALRRLWKNPKSNTRSSHTQSCDYLEKEDKRTWHICTAVEVEIWDAKKEPTRCRHSRDILWYPMEGLTCTVYIPRVECVGLWHWGWHQPPLSCANPTKTHLPLTLDSCNKKRLDLTREACLEANASISYELALSKDDINCHGLNLPIWLNNTQLLTEFPKLTWIHSQRFQADIWHRSCSNEVGLALLAVLTEAAFEHWIPLCTYKMRKNIIYE